MLAACAFSTNPAPPSDGVCTIMLSGDAGKVPIADCDSSVAATSNDVPDMPVRPIPGSLTPVPAILHGLLIA